MSSASSGSSDDDWADLDAAFEKLSPKIDGRKKPRKERQKRLSGAVDGRSLRATGRNIQFNFNVTPEVRSAIARHVPKGSISVWMEEAIIAKLKEEGVEV